MDEFSSTQGRATESLWADASEEGQQFRCHCVLVGIYRRAVHRPWNMIDESNTTEVLPMKFSLSYLLWLIALAAVLTAWWIDHRRQAAEIQDLNDIVGPLQGAG